VAVGGEFKQKIDVGLIAEAAVEGDEGGVVEKGLKFDLPHMLIYRLLRLLLRIAEQPLLSDDLQRGQKTTLPVPAYPRSYLTRKTYPKRPLPNFLSSWNSCNREA
jgi:hypothetical protein